MGDVTLTRNYYKNRITGEFSYLLDEQIKLTPNVRMNIGTKMHELAVDMSYQKIIEQFSQIGIHSRT